MPQKMTWVDKYRQTHVTYEDYAGRLNKLIRDILKSKSIEALSCESRAKTVQSFSEKIHREGKEYHDPFKDITDLVGARIICYYPEEVDDAAKAIEEWFVIDWDNSVDKRQISDPDRFGYQSLHYIVSLHPDRARMVEWKPFAGIKAEIQMRTVLQHAWAAIDHKLRYKKDDIPGNIKRELYRISALLEAADDDFSQVRHKIDLLRKDYKEAINESRRNIPVDAESVKVLLENDTKMLALLVKIGESVGVSIRTPDKMATDFTANSIVNICKVYGIDSIDGIVEIAGRGEGKAESIRSIASAYKSANNRALALTSHGILRIILALGQDKLLPEAIPASGFGPNLIRAIETALDLGSAPEC